MNINCDLSYVFLEQKLESYQEKINEIHQRLHFGQEPYTGWVDYPERIEPALVQDIIATAQSIKKKCTAFVVIGIGGSYLGAKACIELLQSPFYNEHYAGKNGTPKIYFAGHHLSSIYYRELLKLLAEEEVCLCVISKSGTTLEPATVFQIFKAFLMEKYQGDVSDRIYAVTDQHKGTLRAEAEAEGYKTFVVPDDIGGRYSVLTPAGLLAIAVAGIDIEAILDGAREAQAAYLVQDIATNDCYRYGLCRYLLEHSGKTMEIFEVYDGELRYFAEWLKQLFGESGCKEGKGIFPASMQMSTDLHSLGQFLQEGRQNFFETAVVVKQVHCDFPLLPNDLIGEVASMHDLNSIIQKSVRDAHTVNKTPNIIITLPDISAHAFGQMVYFFEKACAVSCYLDDINPFDQPGVEGYKHNIRAEMKKQ